MFLLLVFGVAIVQGQLTVDELFFFHSKYASTGDCTDFQYTFTDMKINSYVYNQLILNCNASSLTFRNTENTPSSVCPNDENDLENFHVHFSRLSQTSIQVNEVRLHGIELCSLDDLIRIRYREYSDYRSQRALLINLENLNNETEKSHLAIATNGIMTFILIIFSAENDTTLVEQNMELIFPNENIFQFNRSSLNAWRIDQRFVRNPSSMNYIDLYQLSKSKFSLFNNETFLIYGTQLHYPRRFVVSIDETSVVCYYEYILQCTFPILPLTVLDEHRPTLKVMYNRKSILNATLTFHPRLRLGKVPTNYSLADIATLNVSIDKKLCTDDSLKSLFSFIAHLWTQNTNGTVNYQKLIKNNMLPVDCNASAEIGREIEKVVHSTATGNITSLTVDLTHQWHDHRICQAERTRIVFY